MKKRVVSFLLALVLVFAMIIVPAEPISAAEETGVTPEACPCGCGEALENVRWSAWDPNNVKQTLGGHFYLDGNYVQTKQFDIAEGRSYVLDLRGYELSTADYSRLFLCNGYLAVLDSVGGGKMCSKTAGSGFGGVLLMQTAKATFELYGGTVTVDADNKGSRRGGLISVGTGSTFNMYGGTLLNGSSLGTQSEEGGCVAAYYASGTIRILGGSVIGGYSPTHGGNIYSKGTTVLKNCTVIGGVADSYGGNIYQSGGSLTIENCKISHGVSHGTAATVTGGGNIAAVSSAAVSIKNTAIHNGYAASYGGNMYYGSGTGTFENVTMTSGVCGLTGNNFRISANAIATMTDCTVDGDISCTGTLTLAGRTTIGLRNHGLSLGTNPVTADGLTEGSEIYVSGEGTVTGANAAYLKPALRTVLTETDGSITATLAADGEIAGYCPHCDAQVSWTAFTVSQLSQSGHYYLTEDLPSFSQKNINADIVLDLQGCDITSSGRVFFIQSGGVALLDSLGGAVVTAPGAAKGHGGLIRNDGGNLQIYGGKYVLAADSNPYAGGLFYTSGATKIAGGVFNAGAYNNESYSGAVLYKVNGAAALDISAGYFAGGRAQNGGTLYVGHSGVLTFTGGHFTDGSASASGGNLYILGTSAKPNGSLSFAGVAITKGQADTSAGNLNITYYKTAKVVDSYIAGGTTNDYGGNILSSANSAFVEYENCMILGGSAKRGGNLYSSGLGSRARLTACQVWGGTATGNGGNLLVNHGYLEFLGGSLLDGTAGADGGNLYSGAGASNESGTANYTKLLKDEKGNAPFVAGGSAENGGNLFFSGVMHLNAAFINNGTATKGLDLYYAKASIQNVFNLGGDVTGNLTVAVSESLLGSPVHGQPITGGTASALNASIHLEGDYGMPQICAYEGDLMVAGAAVVSGEDSTGYATATVAADACKAGEYVKLFADARLNLTRDAVVDLNGFTATVTGDYTLYGMDTVGSGKATWEAEPKTAEAFTAPNGKLYVAITEGTEVTYHLLDMGITGAAIRPSVSGIYYTGSWSCDAALLSQIATYGVAVDAVCEPTDGFMENETTLYTTFDAEALVSGENKTGAIISGILKEDRKAELNDAYGKMPVFAATYVTLRSGTTVVSRGVGYSLYSAMQAVETCAENDPAGFAHNIRPAGEFYRTWKDKGMGSWEFKRISIDPRCPWTYDVVQKAVEENKLHYYFMSGEWHAYSGGSSEPEKWGDSCLIVFPDGQTMLIDSGVSQYGPILVENLQRMGITRIDHLVITHPHSDHQNGAFHQSNRKGNGVLDLFDIGKVYYRGGYDSKNMEASQLVETVCTQRNLPLEILEMGDTLQIGEVSIQVLWPAVGTSEKDTTGVNAAAANNASIVLRFDYQDHSALFTGDIYAEKEADLMELHGELLDVDLLKAPHHGNGITSNSEEFLAAVSPEIAVATGFENIQSRVAQRFTDVGATLLGDRTCGYIHITADGTDEMTYETSRQEALG